MGARPKDRHLVGLGGQVVGIDRSGLFCGPSNLPHTAVTDARDCSLPGPSITVISV